MEALRVNLGFEKYFLCREGHHAPGGGIGDGYNDPDRAVPELVLFTTENIHLFLVPEVQNSDDLVAALFSPRNNSEGRVYTYISAYLAREKNNPTNNLVEKRWNTLGDTSEDSGKLSC